MWRCEQHEIDAFHFAGKGAEWSEHYFEDLIASKWLSFGRSYHIRCVLLPFAAVATLFVIIVSARTSAVYEYTMNMTGDHEEEFAEGFFADHNRTQMILSPIFFVVCIPFVFISGLRERRLKYTDLDPNEDLTINFKEHLFFMFKNMGFLLNTAISICLCIQASHWLETPDVANFNLQSHQKVPSTELQNNTHTSVTVADGLDNVALCDKWCQELSVMALCTIFVFTKLLHLVSKPGSSGHTCCVLVPTAAPFLCNPFLLFHRTWFLLSVLLLLPSCATDMRRFFFKINKWSRHARPIAPCRSILQFLPFRTIGTVLISIWGMLIGNITTWLMIFVLLWLGFATATYILILGSYTKEGPGSERLEEYGDFVHYVIVYFYVALGEVSGWEDYVAPYETMIILLHMIYILMSTLLMLNLIIAMVSCLSFGMDGDDLKNCIAETSPHSRSACWSCLFRWGTHGPKTRRRQDS